MVSETPASALERAAREARRLAERRDDARARALADALQGAAAQAHAGTLPSREWLAARIREAAAIAPENETALIAALGSVARVT